MTNIAIVTKIGTKPRPRFAKIGKFVRAYTPKTALNYERYIASEYQRLGGKYYGNTPVILKIVFYFRLPENTPMYKKWSLQRYSFLQTPELFIPCDNHKDLDNLAKSVLDALNTVAFNDDKQVISLQLDKVYSIDREWIELTITPANKRPDKEIKEIYNDFKRNNRA